MNYPENHKGWAIPTATDIAFALGVLAILGKCVPDSIRVTLTAVAIIDDLFAILVIALFYSGELSYAALLGALACLVVLGFLNYRQVNNLTPYIMIGIVLWICVLKSGVHATLAGVALAMFIPMKTENRHGESPLEHLEHELHPWVAFMILPIFAFANAGVPLTNLSMESILSPLTGGIILGLLVGKPVGVVLFSLIGRFLKLCKLPEDISVRQLVGMGLLTGIGFTMSLFIGTLAYHDIETINSIRLGVLIASVAAGVLGALLLKTKQTPAS